MLQREQDRIVAELDQVTRRIDAHFGDYAEARAHLDDALGLLGDCADIYTRCDDTNRRLCNQAFFTKVFIDEDNELRVEHNRPFEMQLDPQVNANALTWAADMEQGPNLDQRFHWQGFEPCAWGGGSATVFEPCPGADAGRVVASRDSASGLVGSPGVFEAATAPGDALDGNHAA